MKKLILNIKNNILIEKEVKKFIIIFNIVGTLGFAIPFLVDYFIFLTPFALLVNFFILSYFHPNKKNIKNNSIFFCIFLLGLTIEIIGVETKIIFGHYDYGDGLGLKIFKTPLLIGLNWLFLVYATSSVLEKVKINNLLKIIFGATLMLIYDFVLEQVASIMDMWYWKNDKIPIENYIVWFILALFFHALIKIFKVDTKNKIAFIVILCQFLFISALFVIFKLTK